MEDPAPEGLGHRLVELSTSANMPASVTTDNFCLPQGGIEKSDTPLVGV
jgi:hypothetical protein